jgi:hypothetical protein
MQEIIYSAARALPAGIVARQHCLKQRIMLVLTYARKHGINGLLLRIFGDAAGAAARRNTGIPLADYALPEKDTLCLRLIYCWMPEPMSLK